MKKEQLDILNDIYRNVQLFDGTLTPEATINIRDYINNKYFELMQYEINDVKFKDFNPYKWISRQKKKDGYIRPFIGTIYHKDGKGYLFGLNYGIITTKLYDASFEGEAVYENGEKLEDLEHCIPKFDWVFTKNQRVKVEVNIDRIKDALKEFKAFKKCNKDFKGECIFKIPCGAYFKIEYLLDLCEAAVWMGLEDEFYMQQDEYCNPIIYHALEIGSSEDNRGLLMPVMEPSEKQIEEGKYKIYE